MADQLPLPALDAWQAMEVQLIGFPVTPQAGVEQNWWNELTGGDCTSTRKRLARTDNGPFQGRDFTLSIDPLRIVWKADFLPDLEPAMPLFIGTFTGVRDWFSELMLRWLRESCPPLKRLSFAAKCVLQTENREEAYGLLGRYLPSVQVDPNSREMLYRINRPRQSAVGIPDFRINRLVTWSSVKISMQMQLRSANNASAQAVNEQTIEGCLLQLDINSSEEFTDALPHESLPALWSELVEFATEIAERGDVP